MAETLLINESYNKNNDCEVCLNKYFYEKIVLDVVV